MRKIKNYIYTFLLFMVFTSCGEYYKVLNKGLNTDRYKLAVDLYEKEQYKKAIPLFEKLVGPYSGKPQMERIQYMTANSYYETEDYALASYYFTKFITNYPKSSKVEEAAFLSAKSYYLASPKYSLDQQDTYKALTAFQDYIDKYPNSSLLEEANKYYGKLMLKLEKKDFEVAKQYYRMEKYKAAITAFTAFNEEHLGSVFKEDALYYKFKSAYDLGIKSILTKKEQRLKNAKIAAAKFKKTFPESKRVKEINSLEKQIEKEILKTREEFSIISQN